MHAADRISRPTQTTCSLVARLGPGSRTYYTTGASNPCMSPFFPLFSEQALPRGYRAGGAEYNEDSYWWEAERIHRRATARFHRALEAIQPGLAAHEQEMIQAIESETEPPSQETADRFFKQARGLLTGFSKELDSLERERQGLLFRCYWRRYNRLNRIPG